MLASLYVENRQFLAPWQPRRPDGYFTEGGQREAVGAALAQQSSGSAVPLAILDPEGALVGTITLASIIRGAFQSCSVGYWVAERAQGRGLATAALREAAHVAFTDLRLHRIQAETLTHNVRSQRDRNASAFTATELRRPTCTSRVSGNRTSCTNSHPDSRPGCDPRIVPGSLLTGTGQRQPVLCSPAPDKGSQPVPYAGERHLAAPGSASTAPATSSTVAATRRAQPVAGSGASGPICRLAVAPARPPPRR